MVAERPLCPQLVELYEAFENNLRMCRHFQVDRLAADQLDRLLPQEAGNDVLLYLGRRGHNRRERRCRISPNGDRDLQPVRELLCVGGGWCLRRCGCGCPRSRFCDLGSPGSRHSPSRGLDRASGGLGHVRHLRRYIAGLRTHPVAQLFGRILLPLPVHAGGLPVVHLHAVHAHIALAGPRVARDDERQRNVAAAVHGPTLQHRELEHIDPVAALADLDDFLAGCILRRDRLREELADLSQHRQQLQLAQQTLRRFGAEQRADSLGDFIERVHVERQLHAVFRAELVHQHARARVAFDLFKQQRRSACLRALLAEL